MINLYFSNWLFKQKYPKKLNTCSKQVYPCFENGHRQRISDTHIFILNCYEWTLMDNAFQSSREICIWFYSEAWNSIVQSVNCLGRSFISLRGYYKNAIYKWLFWFSSLHGTIKNSVVWQCPKGLLLRV